MFRVIIKYEKSDTMQDLKIKYAQIILKTCLNVEKNQALFISGSTEIIDFIRILANEAYKLGVNDIFFDITNPYLKHDALKQLEVKDLKKSQFWHKEKWNEYAKKGAAFAMLVSENPGLMKDIDESKLNELAMLSIKTKKDFNELREKAMVPWCIAAVPTIPWAENVFPKEKNPIKKLWESILDICLINQANPEKAWQQKINHLRTISDKLNSYHFKTLKYKNSLGTDFSISLPENHIWVSGESILKNKKRIIANFPTEEVFTSPDCTTANGKVYSSKPLSYQDNIIEDFWLEFKDGKVINCSAKKGEKTLQQIIKSCKNSNRLGEVALVEYNSPISESNIVFFETLFDENASCHLALGSSFTECLKNGPKMSKKELSENKLNDCQNHVDFMIGTKDLSIIGITENGEEISIFENGNFTQNFK